MNNLEIAKIFKIIADILEFKEVEWKPRAYRNAALTLESLQEDVKDIYQEKGMKGLKEIPNIGEGLAEKIEEFLKTNKIKEYEILKKKLPKDFNKMMQIPGVGPKKVKTLIKKLNLKSIKQLEKAAKKHKISKLKSFKEKTEENILKGIELFKKNKGRILLGTALPIAEDIISNLKKVKGVKQITYAGSIIRMKETVRDIDILVCSKNADELIKTFSSLPNVKRILAKGHTKASVLLNNDLQVDLRVVPENSYPTALQYFTGNKMHGIKTRQLAIKKGMKLSEYGLFDKKTKKRLNGKEEKSIYKKLGLQYIPPELRRDMGEIELAKKNKIPKLVTQKDIQGDLHVHSTWSDGQNSIKEMALAAKSLGYSFLCISDHSKSLKIGNGITEKELIKKIKEIKVLNKQIKNFTILTGTEVDILKDGSLDYPDKLLKKLDIVIASVHSNFKMPKQQMTDRIITAMHNPNVDIIGHLTGRIINKRPGYEVDIDKIIKYAKKTNTALEVNSQPSRLDINSEICKKTIESKVKISINTDAHNIDELKFMKIGIGTARRGWAKKNDVLNCLSLKDLKKALK